MMALAPSLLFIAALQSPTEVPPAPSAPPPPPAVVAPSPTTSADPGAAPAATPDGQPPPPPPPAPPAAVVVAPPPGPVGPPPATNGVPPDVLRSPPDQYGVPQRLYAFDPELDLFRHNMEEQAAAKRRTGGLVIGAGVLQLVVAVAFFLRANYNHDQAQKVMNSPGGVVIYDPSPTQYAYGGIFAATGVVSLGIGAVMLGTKPDPTALLGYYHDKYR